MKTATQQAEDSRQSAEEVWSRLVDLYEKIPSETQALLQTLTQLPPPFLCEKVRSCPEPLRQLFQAAFASGYAELLTRVDERRAKREQTAAQH